MKSFPRTVSAGFTLAALLALPTISQANDRLHVGLPFLAAGRAHSLLVQPDGLIYGWGDNRNGEVGDGSVTSPRKNPTRTTGSGLQVSAGDSFSLAVDEFGVLSSWGANNLCQLGTGSAGPEVHSPGQYILDHMRSAAAGYGHALAVDAGGFLVAWGDNSAGQLGFGTKGGTLCTPQWSSTGNRWLSAAAGKGFSLALKADGTLWSWGDNATGQLGQGATPATPLVPKPIAGGSRWVAFSAGMSHTLAIKDDGTLWAWGLNDQGQLGINSTSNQSSPQQVTATAGPWKAVAAGEHHSLALKADGTLWVFGDNRMGQLGLNDTTITKKTTPVLVPGLKFVQFISSGGNTSLAVTADGTLKGWGQNDLGQVGTTTNGATCGTTACIKKPTNLLYAIKPGSAAGQELLTSGVIRGATGTNDNWIDSATGASGPYTLAVRADGKLWGWGYDYSGVLGFPATDDSVPFDTPQLVPGSTNSGWLHVATAITSSFGLKADGTLWAWGENDSNGKLGTCDTNTRTQPTQIGVGKRWVAVGASYANAYAITSDGQLWGWGDNANYHAVGDGSDVDQVCPVHIGQSLGDTGYWAGVEGSTSGVPVAFGVDGQLAAWGPTDNPDQPARTPTVLGFDAVMLGHETYRGVDGDLYWVNGQGGWLGLAPLNGLGGRELYGFSLLGVDSQVMTLSIDMPATPRSRLSTILQLNSGSNLTLGGFLSDRSFSGGTTTNHANSIDLTRALNAAPMQVYQTGRLNNFTYTLSGFAPASVHKLRLHFAETFHNAKGKRVFNVTNNGAALLTNFDIWNTAGGQNKAIVQEFDATADSQGRYVVVFKSVTDQSLVAGIEVR